MSVHDKMQSDYIWIKNHSSADLNAKARTHGYHYLPGSIPNKTERYEMIWRSMGKAHDWELEKFRLGKKPVDKGNKRRFFKNLFRFWKNPVGYFYWKTYKARKVNPGAIVIMMFIGFTFNFLKLKFISMGYAQKQATMLQNGQNIQGSGQSHFGYHNQLWGTPAIPMFQFMYYELPGNMIIVNPCRNQVFRKYFEMRKKLGLHQDE
ncbi:hypothetical protein IMG5_054730 [Ichthyophthirius multifiliis]|uniref:Uncharacterized protein n=1 Tax=Ichthyophthirius multifiliis TaxID=5932 RepID=G0QN20_ICHMU|nr:hypothetical protein IMG5_054730 [Ichthyophthirius multifiliis]EGR33383.1 hypothetical protein IMG5_054730 [Ichthyophthirius multifiliis]|eukprot:XP_004037369.1 hypothetical protein IMG5_054730 [Ichthyophthirius multifiliis]